MARENQRGGILLVLGIIAGVILLVIALIAGFGFWAFGKAKEQCKELLDQNAVVQEHIGKINEIELNLDALQERPDPSETNVFAYDVEGPKGQGVVHAKFGITDQVGFSSILEGTLRVTDGKTYDLITAAPVTGEETQENTATGTSTEGAKDSPEKAKDPPKETEESSSP